MNECDEERAREKSELDLHKKKRLFFYHSRDI